jgi:hypothetical protein
MCQLVVVGTSFALMVKWFMHQYSQTPVCTQVLQRVNKQKDGFTFEE